MDPVQIFESYKRCDVSVSNTYNFCPACGTALNVVNHSDRPTCADCGWIHYQNPLPGVVVLVTDEDRILLGERGKSSFGAGKWCIPGGFVEFEEDFLTAAIREVQEETSLKVHVQSILSVVSNFLSPKLHTLVVVLHAQVVGGNAVPGDDLCALKWFQMDASLPEMAFEADLHIIERFYKTELQGAPVDPRFSTNK